MSIKQLISQLAIKFFLSNELQKLFSKSAPKIYLAN